MALHDKCFYSPFYGSTPPLNEVPNLTALVLGIYGGGGERISRGFPTWKLCFSKME